MSYCKFAPGNPIHQYYHAKEYGFPVSDDNVLFERLALEINQAGLSWELMLKKREGFNKAFKDFDIEKVARFGARDIERLLKDEGIIRNRLKVLAVINNAKVIKEIQKTHVSFANWLQIHSDGHLDIKEWLKLFKKTGFKFVGGEIMKEFLQSVGHLPSPHDKECPVQKDIFKAKVLAVVKAIPKGETMTYGEVAKRAGSPQSARAVGALMKQNKDKKIPCHRVVAQNGLGGYNGLRGPSKERLIRKEKEKIR
ncbi:methylated-DNA--[protein]-cysteine S-methyltransferase [Candidatus Nomurabacteria bacterium]|nr:methylated-DNA--[protein]-cysteine S-methyltransferase [Candidatus Nomurabacteria bacterium]